MPNWLTQIQSLTWPQFIKWAVMAVTIGISIGTVAIFISKNEIEKQVLENTKQVNLDQTLQQIETGQGVANRALYDHSRKIDSVLTMLRIVQEKVSENTRQLVRVKTTVTEYIKNDESLTRDEFINIMDGMWDEKKKWKPYSMIHSDTTILITAERLKPSQ